MSDQLPRIAIFGALANTGPTKISLHSSTDAPDTETTDMQCRYFRSDIRLERIINTYDPHVFVSTGDLASFPHLMAASFNVRRRWLHFDSFVDLDTIGAVAFNCYIAYCLGKRDEEPLVSIFTPAFRTGMQRFSRAYSSVIKQTYKNWEWVIVDDSNDDGITADMIQRYADQDYRIKLIRPSPSGKQHSGVIGAVKHQACMNTSGQILVELDHDDELTPDALAYLSMAYQRYPQCGFYYSDNAEVSNEFAPLCYPDGWAWGFGSYREEEYHYMGRGVVKLFVTNAPNINAKTIRGLVGAPNHVRAWRRDIYMSIGGHNRLLHVADDMDLMIRTFLVTTMLRIPKLLYIQYQDAQTTQRKRNKDIQRHVRYINSWYDGLIHERFKQLGVDDWIFDEAISRSNFDTPNPQVEPFASIIANF